VNSWKALLALDLKLLIHRPQNIMATVLYGIMVLTVIHFSIPAGTSQSTLMGSAALWLSLVLSGILGLPRLQHHPDAVHFLPQLITGNMTTSGYYWEKIIAGLFVLVVTGSLLFLTAIMLFNFPISDRLTDAYLLFELGTFGIVVILTLGSALTVGRESWLLPLLVFPLMLPIVMAGTQFMVGILRGDRVLSWAWLHLLVAYNVLMLLGGWFLSEFLWEELPE